jgi:LPXTG-motif cell wall-anchored protein
MKQELFNMTKKHGPKAVVFLLLTVALALTFLLAVHCYAASSDGQAIQAATVYNAYDAGAEGTSGVPDTGILGDVDNLPQTGGISLSTLIGLLGLAMIAAGGTVFTILRKKSHGKNS